METVAQSKTARISPRKVMLVADVIRNNSVQQALNTLTLLRKRSATVLIKLLESAVANAVNNAHQNKDLLFIKRIEVIEGPFLKRFRASTRGRTHPYKKRSSHIKIVLEEKNYGTKS
ncbi:MAG: 50S ribosomal protein L22 [Patescibacteria group bacterium]